jgi:hypothetical protein
MLKSPSVVHQARNCPQLLAFLDHVRSMVAYEGQGCKLANVTPSSEFENFDEDFHWKCVDGTHEKFCRVKKLSQKNSSWTALKVEPTVAIVARWHPLHLMHLHRFP